VGKPLFLHQRDAHDDFLAMMRNFDGRLGPAVVHCFTADRRELFDYLDRDWHIGITGWLCDERRGAHLRELVRHIPAGRLMIETDAPYLLPRTLRPLPKDRRNEPAFLSHIVEELARDRGEEVTLTAANATTATRAFFRLPDPAPRAAAPPDGTPWAPNKAFIWWDGERWTGADVPDFPLTSPPSEGVRPFIITQSGGGHFFAAEWLNEGPFPEHYEPMESPIDRNPMSPNNPQAFNNPIVRVFEQDRDSFGSNKDFPYAATTYRLTEHFHYWTTHARLNSIAQPEKFIEIGEILAGELGISAGDRVKVTSKRGYITAVAVVTKRLIPLEIDGRTVHQIGIPIHWGFKGVARKAHLTNTLTPFVGDGNTQTPEFKSFLVNVEKFGGTV